MTKTMITKPTDEAQALVEAVEEQRAEYGDPERAETTEDYHADDQRKARGRRGRVVFDGGRGRFSGWRRGGLYEFSAWELGLTFRLGDREAITVKETTLTWTPAGGGSPQTAKLVPLSDQ